MERLLGILSTVCIIAFAIIAAALVPSAIDAEMEQREIEAANRCAWGYDAYCYQVADGGA
jgi:hypothetical protein